MSILLENGSAILLESASLLLLEGDGSSPDLFPRTVEIEDSGHTVTLRDRGHMVTTQEMAVR